MLEWLYRIFIGHAHEWEIENKTKVYADMDMPGEDLPVYSRYLLKCKHCGKLKIFNNR